LLGVAGSAEEKEGISENLIFAGFAFGNWPVKEKFRG
jgi:hypothetical protein